LIYKRNYRENERKGKIKRQKDMIKEKKLNEKERIREMKERKTFLTQSDPPQPAWKLCPPDVPVFLLPPGVRSTPSSA